MSLLVPGLILGGNLLGTALAAHQSAKANKAIRSDLAGYISEMQGLFDQERHGDMWSRPDVQKTLSTTRDGLRDVLKSQGDNAIRTGATSERQVAGQGAVAKGYSDSIGNIMSMDARRREMAKNRYMQMLSGLRGQQMQIGMQDAQRWPQLMQNISGLSTAALDVFGQQDIPPVT